MDDGDRAKAFVGFLLIFFLVLAPFAAMVRVEAGFVSLMAALVTGVLFGGRSDENPDAKRKGLK